MHLSLFRRAILMPILLLLQMHPTEEMVSTHHLRVHAWIALLMHSHWIIIHIIALPLPWLLAPLIVLMIRAVGWVQAGVPRLAHVLVLHYLLLLWGASLVAMALVLESVGGGAVVGRVASCMRRKWLG